MKRVKVGILGASGYGGGELIRRLLHHPRAELAGVSSRQYLGQSLSAAWPQFAGYDELVFGEAERIIAACDVLFSAAPHGAALGLVRDALGAGKRVIDLSADYRLSPEDYQTWYGEHPYPEVYARAVYGLCELHREEIHDADLVANPGCYPSAAALALAPLAAYGFLGEDVIVNAASGVSGAGREANMGTHFGEINENVKAYKIAGSHRHTAEIENTLGRVKKMGKTVKTHTDFDKVLVTFTPHLVPMTRGILATCYARSLRQWSDESLLELYRDFYEGEPLVKVQSDLPQTKAVYGSDRCHISARIDARTGQIIALAAIDNLGKGAAGQAVQNFNLMNGFEETLGLALEAIYP